MGQMRRDEKIRQLEQFIVDRDQELNQQIYALNVLLAEKDRALQLSNQTDDSQQEQQHDNVDEEYGVYEIKFNDPTDNDSDVSSVQSSHRQLRQRLLKEQMDHEHLKSKHRESISQLEDYELHSLQQHENQRLQQEVESLQKELQNERKKKDNLDNERRNSLAALSQNMFKKLLDSEHKHNDDTNSLEERYERLTILNQNLTESKMELLQKFSNEMNTYRQIVRHFNRQNVLLQNKISKA